MFCFEHEEELCAALLWVHAPKERVSLYVGSVRVRDEMGCVYQNAQTSWHKTKQLFHV